jgi:hypothetical protein
MRRVLFALALAIAAAPTTACTKAPTSSREERTLSAFQPYLTRTLTPATARAQFGAPDEIVGSGLLIYKYRVDAGRTRWLGFPGEAAIAYARLEAKDGTFTDLTLQ